VTALADSPRTVGLDEIDIAQISSAFDSGALTSEQLVRTCLERIRTYDRQGPSLRAVITVNPHALETARELDLERKAKGRRSLLHGIPVILKDNINTADMPTTAGSIMLEGWKPSEDAYLVKRLKRAGAIILGKANMSGFLRGLRSAHSADRCAIRTI